jgi:eukaryotic-like serine/threonine-protein kinase
MTWLPDLVVDRLRANLASPDLNGTRYRAVRMLARGGMAAVWLAEDTVLHRQVALKILDLAEEEDLAARLLREAEILASLEHPGIVPVHDAGTLADGRVFCCMKYVQGETLEQHVHALGSESDCLRLILRVAEPLAFAHSRSVLHRDLKPGNIMIGPFGEVLVMDWGLAKRIDANSHVTLLTPPPSDAPHSNPPATGVVGTPGFMAPEQERGEAASPRSDIFSLGAVMAFTLTSTATKTENAFHTLPRPLQAICEKAMAMDPASRYGSVEALASDISKYLEQMPVSAYRENIWERTARLTNRHATAVVLVLAYLCMRGLLILFARH